MIEIKTGNIFESDAVVLVNPVNCVGVMGKGLALAFKKQYPANYAYYREQCSKGNVSLGHILLCSEEDKIIANFPTKYHWKGKSSIFDIQNGLDALRNFLYYSGVGSIAIPALGCGLGGLKWEQVKDRIFLTLNGLNCSIELYEPR